MDSEETSEEIKVAKPEILLSAIRTHAILRGEDQLLISKSGRTNTWLIDIRRLCMQAPFLNAVAELFWKTCEHLMPFQVGGMEVAAIPIVSAIVMKSVERKTPVNGFIVRKERKTYGTGDVIEGEVTDSPIIIVDDIFNSGASLEKVCVVLAHKDRSASFIFVLIDFLSTRGNLWKTQRQLRVLSPFTLSDFDLSLAQPANKPLTTHFRNDWTFASPNPNFYHRVPKSFPANDGERVFFGSDSGTFWCLSATDGSVVWRFTVNAHGHKNLWSAPALHDGRVIFGSYDGNVYSLDAATGQEIWRFTGADWVGSSPALAPELGLLFIGLEFAMEGKRGSIVALRLDNGEKVWEHLTKRYTHASPAYWPERQLIACGSNDNEMFLFEATTGAVHWRFETESSGPEKGSIRHAPAFDPKRGHLITGCANGRIYILDVDSGQEVWSVRTDNTIYSVPLVVENSAYIGSTDKYFYVLDLEKKNVRRKIYIGAKIFGPPRMLDGRIYFGACNGIIYEIDPSSDMISGKHQLPDAVTNSLSFNSRLKQFYALTYVNELFAFRRV